MPASDGTPILQLPDRPNLRHLKDQAHDLVHDGGSESLSEAEFTIARRYGFPSWPKLEALVESISDGNMSDLEHALINDNTSRLQVLLQDDPDLVHRQGHWIRRKRHNQYLPLAYAAYLGKIQAMQMLIEAGSDIHAGDEKALRAATYSPHYREAIELLIHHGADPNSIAHAPSGHAYRVIDYPCMLLASRALRCLQEHGAIITPQSVGYVVAANERNPQGKAECLQVMSDAGLVLPDTPPMALHRRDKDRLESLLDQVPRLLSQKFNEAQIFPSEFGTTHPASSAYVTPLRGGVTLLHMAVEFCDADMVQ